MTSIFLVACTKLKQTQAAPAGELYVSPWFKKAKAYTLKHTNTWYILSDKHGLVSPNKVLEPYESRIVKEGNLHQKKEWAKKVLLDFLKVSKPSDTITILAGQQYRKFLVPELEKRGYTVHIPMDGLKLGPQLKWLDKALKDK